MSEEDGMIDSALTAILMAVAMAAALSLVLGRLTWSVPVSTQGYEPTAANVGRMWHQVNSSGSPNELRMVAENSTGAYERMLVGLTS
jgi:hypothetical protein